MKIIACDFDGTLFENRFPEIGPARTHLIERLLEEQRKGAKIILWSCREGDLLQAALDKCAEYGVRFDAVNANLPETPEWMGYDSRKVFATEYWDDRSFFD